MSEPIHLHKEAFEMLITTSRTFSIPISQLSSGLKEAVTSAYLCMRAIDEIEDHPQLPNKDKIMLLQTINSILQKPDFEIELLSLFKPYELLLPDVTLRLCDWVKLAPHSIQMNIRNTTSLMSGGMANWVYKGWRIHHEEDLDNYTFYVAGIVGQLLSELWIWYDNLHTDRELAIAFGRGLQAVNIIRNRVEDLSRGVDFFPEGWSLDEMFIYARRHLALADVYAKDLKPGPIHNFCKIPLTLAYATLDAIAAGEAKLSRSEVIKIVKQVNQV